MNKSAVSNDDLPAGGVLKKETKQAAFDVFLKRDEITDMCLDHMRVMMMSVCLQGNDVQSLSPVKRHMWWCLWHALLAQQSFLFDTGFNIRHPSSLIKNSLWCCNWSFVYILPVLCYQRWFFTDISVFLLLNFAFDWNVLLCNYLWNVLLGGNCLNCVNRISFLFCTMLWKCFYLHNLCLWP